MYGIVYFTDKRQLQIVHESFHTVLAHASCVYSSLLASVKSVSMHTIAQTTTGAIRTASPAETVLILNKPQMV